MSASAHSSIVEGEAAGPAAGGGPPWSSSPGSAEALGSPEGPACGWSSETVGLGAAVAAGLPLGRWPGLPDPLDPPQEYTSRRLISRSAPATTARRRQ